jgi:hypothetical protein
MKVAPIVPIRTGDPSKQTRSSPAAVQNADGSFTLTGGPQPVTLITHVMQQAPDELLPFPYGLERNAANRVERDGDLKVARIGRRKYARRSDVLALVDRLAERTLRIAEPEPADDYDAIVAKAKARR